VEVQAFVHVQREDCDHRVEAVALPEFGEEQNVEALRVCRARGVSHAGASLQRLPGGMTECWPVTTMPRRVLFLQTAREQKQPFESAAMRLGVQLIPFDANAAHGAAIAFATLEAV